VLKKASFNTSGEFKALEELLGKFEYPSDGDVDEVNKTLEKIMFLFKRVGSLPNYAVTRALFTDDGGKKVTKARLVVRQGSKNPVTVKDLKKVLNIQPSGVFFDTFITEMVDWFEKHSFYSKIESNIRKLNSVVGDIVVRNDIPFNVTFSIGDGIIDVSDNHIVLGLSEKVVVGLSDNTLFDERFDTRRLNYEGKFVDVLKQCNTPYDIVKVKSKVTDDLGMYSRKSIVKSIRKVVNRRESCTRVGVGYVDTEFNGRGIFAVVEKKAVSKDVVGVDGKNVVIVENTNQTSVEKLKNEDKIVVSFKVRPFDKKTGIPVDIGILDVIGK